MSPARFARFARLGREFALLEDRSLPSQFGTAWADSSRLTVSFAPDYTATPTGPSLTSLAMASAPGYQREVLRAFQTWAVNTNTNIGLVADSGLPLGTQGAVQGDKRFGDVRVSAAPVGDPNELAFASPFTWAGSTFSGDVIFDSAGKFAVGNTPNASDVFSVAVHEAGHSLGLDHSTEAGSVMNETYSFHTGLSAGDVANIQRLYGARTPDAFDAAGANDTAATASAIPVVPNTGGRQRQAVGDISTASDVDYYKLSVPAGTLALTVRLKASGESLFTGKVTVTDRNGRVVAVGATADPLNNDLSMVALLPSSGDYTIRVEGARSDVFGIGGYRLVTDLTTLASPVISLLPAVLGIVDAGTNNLLGTATVLDPKETADGRFSYGYRGAVETPTDTDFYKIHTEPTASALNVLTWGTDLTPLSPAVHVYDAAGQPVAFQVVANDTGVYSVRVAQVAGDQDYYIQVQSRTPGAVGNYFLAADLNQDDFTPYPGVAAGTVSAAAPQQTGTLNVSLSGVYQVAALATPVTADGSGVSVDVIDAYGVVVLSVSADANQPPATRARYLAAGTYTLVYRYRGNTGTSRFDLFLQAISDPVGPKGSSTSSSSGSSSSSGGYTYSGSSSTQPSNMPATY